MEISIYSVKTSSCIDSSLNFEQRCDHYTEWISKIHRSFPQLQRLPLIILTVSIYSTKKSSNQGEYNCILCLCTDVQIIFELNLTQCPTYSSLYRVRIWDLIIFIPNLIFLIFILFKSRKAIKKLRRTNSHIFFAFYTLVMQNLAIYHQLCNRIICFRSFLWLL